MLVQMFTFWTRLVLIGVLLVSCTTIRTGSHQDDSVSLRDYRSFSWIAADPLILAAEQRGEISALSKKKVVESIERTLENKGYEYVKDADTADFVVSYTVGTREKLDASAYPPAYAGEWGWHLYGRHYSNPEVIHRSYTEGTLGIDVFDGHSKQPVWHGWASKKITTADRQDPSPIITEAVEMTLAQFPSRDR